MQFLIKGSFLFLFLFSPNHLFCQFLNSKNYSTADGLANNSVRSLFLDNENTLWIGTENGISVFKNGNFKNLYKEDGLAHNSCWGMCQDVNGAMWYASYGGGITKFDGKNFKNITSKQGLPVDKTRKVFSHKDKIYVGTEFGISIIDINSDKVETPKQVFPHFGVFIVTEIFEYNDQIYFSALNEGLFKVEYSKNIAKVIPIAFYKNSYGIGNFKDKIYNSNKGFIDVINLERPNRITEKSFGESIIWQYASDKRDQVYGAAWGIFDTSGGLFEIKNEQAKNVSDFFGIDSKSLLNVVYDSKNDILFVGSKDKGFYQVYLDHNIDYNPFYDRKVIDFEDDLILNHEGLYFSDSQNSISLDQFKKFQTKYISSKKQKLPDYSQGFFELNYNLSAKEIQFYEIVKHQENYWISSNIGIFEIDKEARFLNYIPIHTYKFGFTSQNQFFETNPYGGIHIYDDIYKLKVNTFSDAPTDIVRTLHLNGKIYFISVFKGLFSYEDNEFKSYLSEKKWAEEKLKFITKNEKGNLIISSEFGDVFIIDDHKKFKVLEKISKNKIFGNSINFLESYKDVIFIGTEKGLNIYKNGIVRLIDKEQGLKDNIFTTSEIINDILYLGTNKGYYKLNLDKILSDQNSVSKLEISSISINNRVLSDHFKWFNYDAKKIETSHDQNSFSIDFIARGITYPNKLKYRYRLKNTNRWSPFSEKPNVFLPYLPHGKYDLEIEVLDLNAGKLTLFSLLKITVKTPFWLTWWFVLLSIFLVLGIILFFVSQSKKRVEEKALIQKRIAETKLEALLSQMNPHFTFNAMNAIQNYIISNDTLNSIHFIGEFSKLMRKTLDNSSKPSITLEEEMDYLKTYISIENMRFGNSVDVTFSVSEDVDELMPIPTMLLQPFVENVFVHAFTSSHVNPKLTISFEIENKNILLCKIIDNGKGFSETSNSLHKSKGILLAKERLGLLNVTCEDAILTSQNLPSGVVIEVRLVV